MATSPTQRTLKYLREQGYVCWLAERWNPHARIRQDAFGMADILALKPGEPGTLYVQACAGASHAARRTKLQALSAVELAKATGNRVWIISWSKRGARGKVKRWEARIESL